MTKDIKKEVLTKIREGGVKMKSRAWFEVVKISAVIGMIFSAIFAIFLLNLVFYLPKRAGSYDNFAWHRFLNFVSEIPWIFIIIAALLLGFFIWLYRNYEGGYKHRLLWIIIVISVVALVSSFILFKSGLNENLERGRGMRRFYQWSEDQFGPRHMYRRNLQNK